MSGLGNEAGFMLMRKEERIEIERERNLLFISFLERGNLILLLHLCVS